MSVITLETRCMNASYRIVRKFTKTAYQIRGIGLGRLCETIRKQTAQRSGGKVLLIDDFMGDAKFYCEIGEHMGSQIFWRGAYSGDQLRQLKRFLTSGATFIDIGANQGEFTVYASRLVGDTGRVISFEPVDSVREKLWRNIRINALQNVIVQSWALGDSNGSFPIFSQLEQFADGTQHLGLATLFETEERGTVIQQVQVRRLDDIVAEKGINRVDVVKIDIEGGEFAAFKGASSLLARYKPVLFFELDKGNCRAAGYEPDELLAWLRGFNYQFSSIEDGGTLRSLQEPSSMRDFMNILATPAVG